MEAGHGAGFHGFLRERIGADAADSDFRFRVALAAGRREAPILQTLHRLDQSGVFEIAQRRCGHGLGERTR